MGAGAVPPPANYSDWLATVEEPSYRDMDIRKFRGRLAAFDSQGREKLSSSPRGPSPELAICRFESVVVVEFVELLQCCATSHLASRLPTLSKSQCG